MIRKSNKNKKIIYSETKINKNKNNKKKIQFLPSQNDHIFNHDIDNKLNRKVKRQPTPYKIDINNNKKASRKPRFSTSISCSNSNSNSGSVEIKKKDLAYDPDKIKSKLFENTKSMS
eukprot:283390_1